MGTLVLATRNSTSAPSALGKQTSTTLRVLASYLRGRTPAGTWRVALAEFDADATVEEMLEGILGHDPDVVGLSVYGWNHGAMFALADRIAERSPRTAILAGGPQMSLDEEDLARLRREHPGVGTIIQGEGERALASFLALPAAERSARGRVLAGEPLAVLDDIGGPLFAAFPPPPGAARVVFETMRGCRFRCAYCCWPRASRKLRFASAAAIEAELRWAVENRLAAVGLVSSSINLDDGHLRDVVAAASAADPERTLMHSVEADYQLFTREQVRELARLRVKVGVGVQSTGEAANRLMHRRLDRNALVRAIELLREAGIPAEVEFIIGLPGDSLDDIRRTFDFACSLGPWPWIVATVLKVLPGTEFYRRRKELGIVHDAAHGCEIVSSPWLSEEDLGRACEDFRSRRTANAKLFLWDRDGTFRTTDAGVAPHPPEVARAHAPRTVPRTVAARLARLAGRLLRAFPGLRPDSSETRWWDDDPILVHRLLLPGGETLTLGFVAERARTDGFLPLPGGKVIHVTSDSEPSSPAVQTALATLRRWAERLPPSPPQARRGSSPADRRTPAVAPRARIRPRPHASRDVLLVYAPSSYPPLDYGYALGALGAVLHEAGHRVDVFDGYFGSFAELEARVRARPYDVVGISGIVTTFAYQRQAARAVRRAGSGTVIVSGGGLATAAPVELLELIPELDACFIDEAERSLPAFLERLHDDRAKVRGIAWRDGRRIRTTGPPEYVDDLDSLPLPRLGALEIARYFVTPGGAKRGRKSRQRKGQVLTARGCINRCDFCHNSFLEKSLRRRSTDNVLAELDELVRIYDVNNVQFLDETFVTDPAATEDLLRTMRARHPGLTWGAACRADLLPAELLPLLAASGCRGLCFGFDSFSDATLRRMGKKTTAEDNVRAFQDCVKADVLPIANLIIGYDNETEEDIAADLDAIRRLEAWGRSLRNSRQRRLCAVAVRGFHPVFFATPYPGTALFRRNRSALPSVEELLLRYSGKDMDLLQVNVSRMASEVLEARHRAIEDYLSTVEG